MKNIDLILVLAILISGNLNEQEKYNADRDKTIYDKFKLKVNLLVRE